LGTQAKKNVLGRVDSEQMSKLEHILAFGKKPQMMHMSSAPVLGTQYGKPVRKIKSQTSIKNWEKIKKSNYLIEDYSQLPIWPLLYPCEDFSSSCHIL
jgi:hypothetical protein